jgi:hypothetical protein
VAESVNSLVFLALIAPTTRLVNPFDSRKLISWIDIARPVFLRCPTVTWLKIRTWPSFANVGAIPRVPAKVGRVARDRPAYERRFEIAGGTYQDGIDRFKIRRNSATDFRPKIA